MCIQGCATLIKKQLLHWNLGKSTEVSVQAVARKVVASAVSTACIFILAKSAKDRMREQDTLFIFMCSVKITKQASWVHNLKNTCLSCMLILQHHLGTAGFSGRGPVTSTHVTFLCNMQGLHSLVRCLVFVLQRAGSSSVDKYWQPGLFNYGTCSLNLILTHAHYVL